MGVLTSYTNALQNLIPNKLNDDDPLMEDSWNKLVDYLNKALETLKAADKTISPVGMTYFQLPGKPSPVVFFPGSTWTDVSHLWADRFPRIKSMAGYGNGQAGGHGNTQGDAIRDFRFAFEMGVSLNYGGYGAHRSLIAGDGAVNYTFSGDIVYSHRTTAGSGGRFGLAFNPSRAGVPTAPENRPYSMAITVWECTA